MTLREVFSRKNKGWALFWVEGATLFVAILLIVLLLNYFQVISLTKISSIFSYLPVKKPSFLTTTSSDPIVVNSQRNDYEIAVNNQKLLEEYLKNSTFKEKVSKELNRGLIKRTIITLTGEKNLQYTYAYFNGATTIKFSYQYAVTDNVLVLFIYLPDEELRKPTASQLFGRAFLYAISPHDENVMNPLPQNNDIDTLFSVGRIKTAKEEYIPVKEIKK